MQLAVVPDDRVDFGSAPEDPSPRQRVKRHRQVVAGAPVGDAEAAVVIEQSGQYWIAHVNPLVDRSLPKALGGAPKVFIYAALG